MWLEYIRYRFRLNETQNGLQLAQGAALRALRNSPRCRSWRVVPAASDPSLCTLEIEWDPGATLTPFRGSEEFEKIQAALTEQVKALEEADYRADSRLLQRILGGPEALFRLAEGIVVGIMQDAELGSLFHSDDGSKRGRLGLWLLEVLGGPDLFSSSYPSARIDRGPLAGALLDLEDRERLLEIARNALPSSLDALGLCVLGSLRAYVPLYPPRPSERNIGSRLLEDGAQSSLRASVRAPKCSVPPDDEPASHQRALARDAREDQPSDPLTPRPTADAGATPCLSTRGESSRVNWRLTRGGGTRTGRLPDTAARRAPRFSLRKRSS